MGNRDLLVPIDIDLQDVTVRFRYWYTNENTRAQQFWVDYAQIGNAKVTGKFVRPYMLHAGSNSYLEVGFAPGAGMLHPGQNTGEIQTRFNNTDWSSFSEGDDYSYDGSKVSYADWSKMTVYVAVTSSGARSHCPAIVLVAPSHSASPSAWTMPSEIQVRVRTIMSNRT